MKYHKIIELNKSDKVYLVTNIINNQIIDTPEIVELNVSDILPGTKIHNKLCETYKVDNFVFKETDNSVYFVLKEREVYKPHYDSRIQNLPLFGNIYDTEAFIYGKNKEKDRLNYLIDKIDSTGETIPYFLEKRKRHNSDYEYNLYDSYKQKIKYGVFSRDDVDYLLSPNFPEDYFIDLYCQKLYSKHIDDCNFDTTLPESLRLAIDDALNTDYNIAELCYDWMYTDVSEFEFDDTIRQFINFSLNIQKLVNDIYLYGYKEVKNNGK